MNNELIFQSPFYRVFECNVGETREHNGVGFSTFSPLSIGSLSVTAQGAGRESAD